MSLSLVSLSAITTAVAAQKLTTNGIDSKIEEAKRGNNEIGDIIQVISTQSKEGLSSSVNVSRSAAQMDELASNLKELMKRFS